MKALSFTVLATGLFLNILSLELPAQELALWAIDDSVRIHPETGKAIEESPALLPGGISGDYRTQNWIWSSKDQAVNLVGAKNEVVAFQVIVEGAADGIQVEATPFTGSGTIPASNIKLFREWYIWTDLAAGDKERNSSMFPLPNGWYPEIAVPLSSEKLGNGFSIPCKDFHNPDSSKVLTQKNQAVWVDLHVPFDAAAGNYTGKINVKTAAGATKSIAVNLKVWNFAIPKEMNMYAEFMNYGQTLREKSRATMYEYFKVAHEHRTFISDNKADPKYKGTDYDWAAFDEKFGPLFDGSAFKEGPTAGVPIPFWVFPIEYAIKRPDKAGGKNKGDWPVASPKTPTKFGVDFTPEFKKELTQAIQKFEGHFDSKGWTKTNLGVFQDSLDEPALHKDKVAGKEQLATILGTAKVIKESGAKRVMYKIDIGGGFERNLVDLDGNGKVEGPIDVANYLGEYVKIFSIHGLCLDVDALAPFIKKNGVWAVFYNGYMPRVGPNVIDGELLGFRTWGVTAWRSGVAGWADWQFRIEDDVIKAKKKGEKGTKIDRQPFYETTTTGGRNLYFYRGEQIGLADKIFASLRLKSARRGAQDFEMLRLLALKDQARAEKITAAVCGAGLKLPRDSKKGQFEDDEVGVERLNKDGATSQNHWSHSPEAWEKFRREVGDALNQ
jgi:hypothetical protein